MTEQEYGDAIAALIPDEGDLPLEVISLIDAAVKEHPDSAPLWQKRAHLIQLEPGDTPHPLEEALASYHRAFDLAPDADIAEDIAHFHDAVMDDEGKAKEWFAKAKKIREDNN